jgi:hypothetical protein
LGDGEILCQVHEKKLNQIYGSQIILLFGNNWSWIQSWQQA